MGGEGMIYKFFFAKCCPFNNVSLGNLVFCFV